MKKILTTLLPLGLLFFTACSQKIDHHPKHPNYAIKKPKVIYTPSKKNLDKMVKKLQGTPYVWAEEGPNKFDCSGFTYYLYGSMGIEIPRVAREQAKRGKRIGINELQYGDLIFFATSKKNRRKITHVGMYLGDGWFTHASTVKNEVIYSNLYTSPYYKKRLRVCRRYLPETPIKVATKTAAPWKIKEVSPPNKEPLENLQKEKTVSSSTTLNKAIVIKAPIQEMEQQKEGNFYVQVGSFIGKPKNHLLYKITHQGFTHKIIQFPKEGRSISKLLIGPYSNRDEATQALTKVRETIKSDAFIAEIR